ncbi:MAG: class IV adenylate cyclase [Chloroflexi bacterium]|nr:class IV adenylate cyclase [Chloroflexota bacterium]
MADDKLRETEVKLYTPDLAAVRQALEANGAVLLKPRVFERNLRYDSADGRLMAGGIVLRLRRDEAVKLTYKDDARIERGIVSRFEAEVTVSDLDTMDLILQRLGYRVALIYEKYRTTYELSGAEIVLDELPYGNFTEIEGDAETIERVVEVLGLGGARRMSGSYTDIYLALRERLNLDVEDCTFDEFVGVDVSFDFDF